MKLDQRLTALLAGIADPHTNVVLEAAPTLTDDIYNAYVRYVGKLDALPRNQLAPSDLVDQFNRFRPMTSWPTKTTRHHAADKWAEYNTKLQQGDIATTDPNPCDDPDEFIAKKFEDCMNAGRRIAKWDHKTAYEKCSKQMHLLDKAVQNICKKDQPDDHEDQLVKDLMASLGTYDRAVDPFAKKLWLALGGEDA